MRRETASNSNVLHLCWEFPPLLEGGLGQACAGIVAALQEEIPLRVLAPSLEGGIYEPLSSGGVEVSVEREFYVYQSGYTNLGESLECGDIEGFYRRFLSGEDVSGDGFLEEVLHFNRAVLQCPLKGEKIVHAHDWLTILAGVELKRRFGCRLLWHVHSLQSDRVGYHDRGLIYQLERWGAKMADGIVAVSEYTKGVLVEAYGVLPEKIQVVHNGIDTERGEVKPFGTRRKILFLGRMTGQKSPEFMIEVARVLLRLDPIACVILAGVGERLPVLREVVDFRNLQGNVHFVGRVDPGRVRGLLENVDILCLPSLSEPFGLVALEAAMAGVAVVMSGNCGAAEILKSAHVVKGMDQHAWADAIEQIFEAEDSTVNRQRVQKEAASRTWHDAAGELLKIYSDLTG